MRLPILLLSLSLGALMAQQPTDTRGWINQGVQAFKSARYDEAVTAFQKAVDLDPNFVTAHLYLGTAYMQQFIPGAVSPENSDLAFKAESEFQRVLMLDANNKVALASLASLQLNQKKWDEAKRWYDRLISVDPGNADAYYSEGFIDWSLWYPEYAKARAGLGMRPEQPGPLPEGAVKQDLKNRFTPVIEDGIANLQKALAINPMYDDAMAYMNLFIRERADLRSAAEYRGDIAEADQWVQRVLEVKRQRAAQGTAVMRNGDFSALTPAPMVAAPPPPPPPPPPPGQGQGGRAGVVSWDPVAAVTPAPPPGVQRIRIGGAVQQAKLAKQPAPIYPPLAVQARISGTVRFNVIIARDGTVSNLVVLSGHPLLVPAAIDAVKQWVYQPTLLNGEPVEVATTVDVQFTLPQ